MNSPSPKTRSGGEPASQLARFTRWNRRALAFAALPLVVGAAIRTEHFLATRGVAVGTFDLGRIARSDARLPIAAACEILAAAIGTVTLAAFLSTAVSMARAIGIERVRVSPRIAAWSALVPLAHLFAPFLVLRHLVRYASVQDLPAPAPRLRDDGSDGYRDAAADAVPPAIRGPRPPIAILWFAWIVAQGSARFADALAFRGDDIVHVRAATAVDLAADVATLIALALAARVFRGVDAALREHERRRRFAPVAAR